MDDPTVLHRRYRVRAYLSYDPATFRDMTVHVAPGQLIEEAVADQLPMLGLQVARRYLVVDVQAELDPVPYVGD